MSMQTWPIVLEVAGKPVDEAIIESAYRRLAKTRHPDAGGSNQEMVELNLAKTSSLQWMASERRKRAFAAQQAEAVEVAAQQAASNFQNAYHQQMANSMQGVGSFGAMGEGFANSADREEDQAKSKWQRIRDILRGREL